MFLALATVVLSLGGLSAVVGLRVEPTGPNAEQARGFCVVGAVACVVVALAVAALGLVWDARIGDAVAIIALFALVVYHLAALAIGSWSRRSRGNAA